MRAFLLPLLLVAGVGLPPAAAQDAGRAEVRGRKAWFAATVIPEDLENPVLVMAGKDLTRVILSKREPSEPVKIPADGIIRIVREVPDPANPGKPAYRTLAQARVPDGTGKALIILVPAAKQEGGPVYQCKVLDLAEFAGGDYLYINLTSLDVAVRLGDQKIPLKPGQIRIHDTPVLRKAVNVPVSYHFYNPDRKKWRLISASTVVLRSTRREICIFSWDPRFNRIDYHGMTVPVSE